MASILVVGQEQRSLERFHRVLSAEGWRVRIAQGRAQALQAAALERPDLVLTGAEMPGAEELASAFRRSAGGPGIVVVMSDVGSPTGPAVLGDDRLRSPFGDEDLVAAVRRMLAAQRDRTGPQAQGAPPPTVRLTSQEIFGDVLAEVEGQFVQPGTAASTASAAAFSPQPSAASQAPPGAARSPAAPVAAAASPGAAAAAHPSRPSYDGDVQRKLEATLSGVFGGDPRAAKAAAAPAQPARRADQGGAADIEAMLSKTLSDLGARPRPASAAPAAGAARPAAAVPPAVSPPAVSPPAGAAPRPAAATPPRTEVAAAGAAAATVAAAFTAPAPPTSPTPPERVAAPQAQPAAAVSPPSSSPTAPASPMPAAVAATPAPPATSAASASPTAPAVPVAAAPPAASLPAATPAVPAAPAAASAAAAGPTPVRPAPPSPAAPPPAGPPPSPPTAAESTGVRRRMTGAMALSEIEEMAKAGRKVEPSSRPGLASQAPAPPSRPGAPAAAASSASSAAGAPRVAPPPPAPTGSVLPGGDSPLATQRIQMVPRETPEPAGETFGQYTLLERIAVGGMAEVWKARMRGVEGFQKTVAIKKILPYMTGNTDFISMFIDEAKLAAQLSHPNIVHIYDLGKIGSDFYIAMEYVEGKDLRSLLNAARQHDLPLPLGLALLIGVRLANALGYAHRKRDFEGREMALVHRDVSPQNVLISFDGDVKLCDFGIAKAVSKVGQTQMGALKGKLQYMSPEQARGTQVDARSDIFSLGAVLFEMLTGQRLFDGDSEMSVLEAVRQVKVRRPSQVVPTIPREIDDIVMHALAGRPEDRFQTAGELEQRLEAVLYALKPSPSYSDLAAYVRRVLESPPATPATAAAARPPAAASPAARPATQAPHAAAPVLPSMAAATAAAAAAAARASAAPSAAPPPAARGSAPAATPLPIPQFHGAPPPASSPVASAEPPAVAPLAPLGEVRMEEGSRPGRLLLAAAVVVLVLGALLTYFVLGRRNAAAPTGGAGGAAGGGTAAGPRVAGASAGATAAGNAGAPGGAAARGGQLPANGATAAGAKTPAGKTDVQGVVDQEVARRAEELKKKLEEQQKQLQKELDKTKAGKTETANAAAANPSGAVGGATKPSPASPASPGGGSEDAAARVQPRPSTPAEPRAAAEPPANPAGAAPAASGSSGAPQEGAARTAEPAGRPAAGEAAGGAGSRTAAAGADGGPAVPPKLVSTPKPEYPPLARKLGVQGVVVLSVLVDEQGRVEDVQVLEPISQNVGINEAALQVARGARFTPATRNGTRVKMWTRLRIPFKK
jgi:TonB family protein